jgi:methyl-galactoside transport system permease protein
MNLFRAFVKSRCILIALLLAFLILLIAEPALFSFRHFRNILFDAAPLMLLAAPFAFCVIQKHIDVSFGRCAALMGIVAASLLQSADFPLRMFEKLPQLPVILPLLFVMLLGALFSGANLLITTRLRLPPVLTGLFFMGLFQGLITLYLARTDENDRILEHFATGFLAFGTDTRVVIAAFAICIAFALVVPKVSGASGITGKSGFAVIAICGCLYALSGVMTAARTATIGSTFMFGSAFSVLAGAVAGGVSLLGGKGSVLWATAGTLVCTAVLYAIDFIFPVSGVVLLVQTFIIGAAFVQNRKTFF